MSRLEKVKHDIQKVLQENRIPVSKNFLKKVAELTPFEVDSLCLTYLDDYYGKEKEGFLPLVRLYEKHFGGPPKGKWEDVLDKSQGKALIELLTRITHRNRGAY